MSIAPCAHPTCNDGNGNPTLTTQTMCDPCRRHYRRQLDWLIHDYITLKTTLPTPPTTNTHTRHTRRETFGHPAEWASDTCRDIAELLNDIEDQLRHLNNTGPALTTPPETRKVADAYRYLTNHFNQLCEHPNAAPIAEAIRDTHNTIRTTLGHTRWTRKLPVPCPTCDTAALTQTTGHITCSNCSREIREDLYPLFARIALDHLIDTYDAQHTP